MDATLRRAPAFVAACYVTFARCLADVQGAFGGIRRYQLADAASHLQASLRASVPLVRRWVPSLPACARVDPTAHPDSGGGGQRGRSSSGGRAGTGMAGQEQRRRRERRDFSPVPRTARAPRSAWPRPAPPRRHCRQEPATRAKSRRAGGAQRLSGARRCLGEHCCRVQIIRQ
ncbi:hypothetical protein BAE44_0012479 [Dichanthelium oligosanthes]|uniref:Uncharacterized protein n=1 Tax=Dichanthelium oligosanthes TaxID=888268 RepID=A0A1E5VN49_9POAL|nr:hypothetical protein BAE44_0012479 [Dichanthelium oligosanthes]